MSEIAVEPSDDAPDIRRLTFDLDVEVCVVGGGLAGLSVALEAARMGASVALIEQRRIGWGASGNHLGSVRPGFDVSAETIIARIGRKAAAELWRMSQTGVEMVRVLAAEMPNIAISEGALDVAASSRGNRALDAVQQLGSDFGIHVERWTTDRLRDVLDTKHFFNALHYPRAFQIDNAAYLRGLVAAARRSGVRIFEETPVSALDVSGTRKRVVTPSARLRASHVVLAGNVHLGAALPRLTATLLPVWRYGAITVPLGGQLSDVIDFGGAIADSDGIDRFRVLADGRLIWSSPETTWQRRPQNFAGAIQRRIRRIFPSLRAVQIAETFGGAMGQTVHGMPQIGQLRPGLWVASGFGRQGLNTTAMAGRIIARGILYNDDRWRLFGPFDLIWAGGRTGLVAGYVIEQAARGRAAVVGALARRHEAVAEKVKIREARIAAASRRVSSAARPVVQVPQAEPVLAPQAEPEPAPRRDPLPPSPFLEMPDAADHGSQEQETDDVRSQQSEQETSRTA
jgi:glycine/D-amino acid oxidase-like deaminating enzyme